MCLCRFDDETWCSFTSMNLLTFRSHYSYIMLGALLFKSWEGWDLLDSSYFCFISLSSIGFGDLVPGESVSWIRKCPFHMQINCVPNAHCTYDAHSCAINRVMHNWGQQIECAHFSLFPLYCPPTNYSWSSTRPQQKTSASWRWKFHSFSVQFICCWEWHSSRCASTWCRWDSIIELEWSGGILHNEFFSLSDHSLDGIGTSHA